MTRFKLLRSIWFIRYYNNGLLINANNTKEMVIYFSKKLNINDIPRLYMHGSDIERITRPTFKRFGDFTGSDFLRDCHVAYLPQKVVKPMHCIDYLHCET